MLGAKVADLETLRYPLLGSPKFDGIRAVWWEEQFYSRTLKPIPNRALTMLARKIKLPNGWEGELIYGDPITPGVFAKTSSAVMTVNGSTEGIKFHVFDNISNRAMPFRHRTLYLREWFGFALPVPQQVILTPQEAQWYEEQMVGTGYEGIILRDPQSRYKNGRSTLSEQGLLKVKRFEDGEFVVSGFEEKMHNANAAQADERGYMKRTSHKENQVPTGTLGALIVNWHGRPLGVGSGFTDAMRAQVWANRSAYLGKLAKIKYAPTVKDLPRHPVFLGWRSKEDM